MGEIKTEVKQDINGNHVITEDHTIADIVRFVVSQSDSGEVQYLLDEIKGIENWQRKVADDLTDIQDKIRGLHRFMSGPTYMKLPVNSKWKLGDQLRTMASYAEILRQRMEDF